MALRKRVMRLKLCWVHSQRDLSWRRSVPQRGSVGSLVDSKDPIRNADPTLPRYGTDFYPSAVPLTLEAKRDLTHDLDSSGK